MTKRRLLRSLVARHLFFCQRICKKEGAPSHASPPRLQPTRSPSYTLSGNTSQEGSSPRSWGRRSRPRADGAAHTARRTPAGLGRRGGAGSGPGSLRFHSTRPSLEGAPSVSPSPALLCVPASLQTGGDTPGAPSIPTGHWGPGYSGRWLLGGPSPETLGPRFSFFHQGYPPTP